MHKYETERHSVWGFASVSSHCEDVLSPRKMVEMGVKRVGG